MKVLITGSEGFVGRHLAAEFSGAGYDVVRCDIREALGVRVLDILDEAQVAEVLSSERPDVLVHLAGQADVGLSWRKPRLTFELNTVGLVNLLEAVRKVNPGIRVVAVGSSDEYGQLLERGQDVTEETPLHPMTPYAVSKQAQESLGLLYGRSYGMNICMTRQFNLGGAGQAKGFLISDFASGIAEIEAGKRDYLLVGNLDSARDFTHVKDACRAMRLIAEKGVAGRVYNICSGETHTAREILDRLAEMSAAPVRVVQDPERMRPSDTPVIRGNHGRLTADTGWEPELGLDCILADALDYWRGICEIE